MKSLRPRSKISQELRGLMGISMRWIWCGEEWLILKESLWCLRGMISSLWSHTIIGLVPMDREDRWLLSIRFHLCRNFYNKNKLVFISKEDYRFHLIFSWDEFGVRWAWEPYHKNKRIVIDSLEAISMCICKEEIFWKCFWRRLQKSMHFLQKNKELGGSLFFIYKF